MTDEEVVPMWALSTGGTDDALLELLQGNEAQLSAERLGRLRHALAALSDDPPVLLERHVIRPQDAPSGGRIVSAASPLARTLGEIVASTRGATSTEVSTKTGEVLYRMVLPDKLAGQLVNGTARQMTAKSGGVYSAVLGKTGIAGNARFVPVAGGGAAAGGAAAAAGAGTVGVVLAAAPVVLLLAATAGSVYAEEQRRVALQRVEDILHQFKADELDKERDELNGAVPAIAKATALLADEGRLGTSLGLDSAVNRVDTAVSRAARRLGEWERALADLDGAATPADLHKAFPGLGETGGEFEAKLRLAVFAFAMKRRVAVLQAAEHTDTSRGLSLSRFMRELASDTHEVSDLEDRVASLLAGIADLTIQAPSRFVNAVYRRSEVQDLLTWTPRLRELAERSAPATSASGDLEICFLANSDGSLRILEPAPVRVAG